MVMLCRPVAREINALRRTLLFVFALRSQYAAVLLTG